MATSEPGEDAVAILDCHCHAWRRWPYLPPVPDEDTRGAVELLLFEMEQHQVEQAMVVCAAIDHNADNVDYVSRARSRARGELKRRLHLVADLDCTWHDTYHTPGAPERLRALADRYELVGFTHYLGEHNDGWLRSEEADAVFAFAAERRLIVSLGAPPQWQVRPAPARRAAPRRPRALPRAGRLRGRGRARFTRPRGGAGVRRSPQHHAEGLPDCITSPRVPGTIRGQTRSAGLERVHDAYGPNRLCWGSDFPACTRYTTFRQTLEVVRSHCPFLDRPDLASCSARTCAALLASGQAGG